MKAGKLALLLLSIYSTGAIVVAVLLLVVSVVFRSPHVVNDIAVLDESAVSAGG